MANFIYFCSHTLTMRKIILLALAGLFFIDSWAQSPVNMAAQPGLTYTENFTDIANWTDNFASGIGASRFGSVAIGGSTSIPSPTRITVSSALFQGTEFFSGVQKGSIQLLPTQSIVLLSTGTTDNTSSVAIDFFMNFTGVNAGTLSFNWANVLNSSGNRTGSLRVYSSTDGLNFTEISGASILNFTNSASVSGTVSNINLPAAFNNSPTARLRFYYHNGTGGTSGSRPKISIDNLTVTATTSGTCSTPPAQPTAINFPDITSGSIQGSFTGAIPAPNEYLVLVSTSPTLTNLPVDGEVYNAGDNLGDGTVVSRGSGTSFTAAGLASSSTYYFFVFSLNSACANGPKYLTILPLTGSASTLSGLPNCTAPATQPTGLFFSNNTSNSIQGSFNTTTASLYLVVRSSSFPLSASPANGSTYQTGDVFGNATVIQSAAANNFTATGLTANSLYYFFVFAANNSNCSNGPAYNLINPLNASSSTLPLAACSTPLAQPTGLDLTTANTSITGVFTPSLSADHYLTIRSTSPTLSALPVNNTDYAVGAAIGNGIVIANDPQSSFSATGLTPNTLYYFFVFASQRNCSGGTKYLTVNPLTANASTNNVPVNNYYFGTLHSHSDFSDGNQDNPGYTPAQDYNYALTALCMDFLGISDHNHYSSPNNPGMLLANYHAGLTQTDNFNSTHPNFLAMYGMEWGVISGGGHVVVHGNGLNSLFGWESNVGGTAGQNYDVFVAKNDYSSLFSTINFFSGNNTFGSLAHPNLGDFGNLANTAYNSAADDAISATTVESGPATSTNTTYSNPGSSMSYLWYYQTLLSKGYHLGPTIDHDNHNTTFGKTTFSRTAVVSPSITKAAMYSALRNMNFYATQDCDTKVDFTINTRIMGSIFTDRNGPVIAVNLTDPTNSLSGAIIRIMYGVPGSGVLAVKIDSAIGAALSFTHTALQNFTTGYYYADINIGSKRIVTSPIWYTRVDGTVAVRFGDFSVQKITAGAYLSWRTAQEINSRYFSVERSADGVHWEAIGTVAAAGYSNSSLLYGFTDREPLEGKNFYRIKQVDVNNRFEYSPVRSIEFKNELQFTVWPNPATDFTEIKLGKKPVRVMASIINMNGKTVYRQPLTQQKNMLNMKQLAAGVYMIKLTDGDEVSVQKLLVL